MSENMPLDEEFTEEAKDVEVVEDASEKSDAEETVDSSVVEDENETSVEDENTEASEEGENSEKKSFFGKKKDKEVEKLKEAVKELQEKSLRQLAEFENFRTRSDKEKSQMFDVGAKSVIEKMLPVMDNFERALASIPDNEESKGFVEGMQLIFKQLETTFDEIGVKPIEAVGKEFNPDLHSAVTMVDDDEKESGTVAEELQKGYTYHDTVVRHSMVKVVN